MAAVRIGLTPSAGAAADATADATSAAGVKLSMTEGSQPEGLEPAAITALNDMIAADRNENLQTQPTGALRLASGVSGQTDESANGANADGPTDDPIGELTDLLEELTGGPVAELPFPGYVGIGAGSGPTAGTPAEVTPIEVPPAEVPSAEVPSAEVPSAEVPPGEVTPAEVTPAVEVPAEGTPTGGISPVDASTDGVPAMDGAGSVGPMTQGRAIKALQGTFELVADPATGFITTASLTAAANGNFNGTPTPAQQKEASEAAKYFLSHRYEFDALETADGRTNGNQQTAVTDGQLSQNDLKFAAIGLGLEPA